MNENSSLKGDMPIKGASEVEMKISSSEVQELIDDFERLNCELCSSRLKELILRLKGLSPILSYKVKSSYI